MTDKAVKVGDVVAWKHVPLNTMALWYWADVQNTEYHVKNLTRTGRGKTARVGSVPPRVWCRSDRDSGQFDPDEPVTIVALNLTGNETADELRALAEAFERDHPAA